MARMVSFLVLTVLSQLQIGTSMQNPMIPDHLGEVPSRQSVVQEVDALGDLKVVDAAQHGDKGEAEKMARMEIDALGHVEVQSGHNVKGASHSVKKKNKKVHMKPSLASFTPDDAIHLNKQKQLFSDLMGQGNLHIRHKKTSFNRSAEELKRRNEEVLQDLLQQPSDSEAASKEAAILAGKPQVCDHALVNKMCHGHHTSARHMAHLLGLAEHSVSHVFHAAGLHTHHASCQDVCTKVLAIIPRQDQPPKSQVNGRQWKAGGRIYWDIDVSPEAMKHLGDEIEQDGPFDPGDDEGKAEDAGEKPQPITHQDVPKARSKMAVATQICEFFMVYPYVNPVTGSSFYQGAPPDGLPSNTGYDWCQGDMTEGGRWNCYGRAMYLRNKVTDPTCCKCWDGGKWPAEVNRLYLQGYAAILVDRYWWWLGWHGAQLRKEIFSAEPGDTQKKTLFNSEMQRLHDQFFADWETTTFCWDGPASPLCLGYATSWGTTPGTMSMTTEGWQRPDGPRMETIIHEMAHLPPLGMIHDGRDHVGKEVPGQELRTDPRGDTGPLVNAYLYDEYLGKMLEKSKLWR